MEDDALLVVARVKGLVFKRGVVNHALALGPVPRLRAYSNPCFLSWVYTYVYTCMYTYVYTYVCRHMYVDTHTRTHTRTRTHTHTHTHKRNGSKLTLGHTDAHLAREPHVVAVRMQGNATLGCLCHRFICISICLYIHIIFILYISIYSYISHTHTHTHRYARYKHVCACLCV